MTLHEDVLRVTPPAMNADEEEWRRWVMYSHYEQGLDALDLVRDHEGITKSSSSRRMRITALGMLLLDAIDRRPQERG